MSLIQLRWGRGGGVWTQKRRQKKRMGLFQYCDCSTVRAICLQFDLKSYFLCCKKSIYLNIAENKHSDIAGILLLSNVLLLRRT